MNVDMFVVLPWILLLFVLMVLVWVVLGNRVSSDQLKALLDAIYQSKPVQDWKDEHWDEVESKVKDCVEDCIIEQGTYKLWKKWFTDEPSGDEDDEDEEDEKLKKKPKNPKMSKDKKSKKFVKKGAVLDGQEGESEEDKGEGGKDRSAEPSTEPASEPSEDKGEEEIEGEPVKVAETDEERHARVQKMVDEKRAALKAKTEVEKKVEPPAV